MRTFMLLLILSFFSHQLKASNFQDFEIQITNASLYEIYYKGEGAFGKTFHGKISPSSTIFVTAENGIALSTAVSFSWKDNANESHNTCFMKKTGEIYVVGDPKKNDDPLPYQTYNASTSNPTWTPCG